MSDTLKGILTCVPIVAAIFLAPYFAYKIWKLLSRKRIDPKECAEQERLTAFAHIITGNGSAGEVLARISKAGFSGVERAEGSEDRIAYSTGTKNGTLTDPDGFCASVTARQEGEKVTVTVSVDRWNEKDGLSSKKSRRHMDSFITRVSESAAASLENPAFRAAKKKNL